MSGIGGGHCDNSSGLVHAFYAVENPGNGAGPSRSRSIGPAIEGVFADEDPLGSGETARCQSPGHSRDCVRSQWPLGTGAGFIPKRHTTRLATTTGAHVRRHRHSRTGELSESVLLFRELTTRLLSLRPDTTAWAMPRCGRRSRTSGSRISATGRSRAEGMARLCRIGRRPAFARRLRGSGKRTGKSRPVGPRERIAHSPARVGLPRSGAWPGCGNRTQPRNERAAFSDARRLEATAAQHMKRLPDLYDIARQFSAAGNQGKAVEILEQAMHFIQETSA